MVKPQVTSFAFPWQGALHFSQSVRVEDLVFASGQAGFLPEGGFEVRMTGGSHASSG